jgi:hypothetical protein
MYIHSGLSQPQGATRLPPAPPTPSCPIDLTGALADQAVFDRIRAAMDCELRITFASSTHPGLYLRRQRLKALVLALPWRLASTLQRELERTQSPFAKLFWSRLHPATARELLRILCKPFFKEYELRFNPVADSFSVDTNPTLTAAGKAQRKQDVMGLIGDARNSPGLLWKRLLARADAALERPPTVPSSLSMPGPAERLAVMRLSGAQVSLFRESFPDGTGDIDFGSFQSAFERFANGELRDPSLPGHRGFLEPNGGNYFLFAEFAFLCIDLSIEESVWTRALTTFVKTQEIFMHVYRERPKSPPPAVNLPIVSGADERRDILPVDAPGNPGFDFTFFTPIGNSTTVGRGQSDFNRKMRLRAKYDGMSLAALKIAARDNLARAIRMR